MYLVPNASPANSEASRIHLNLNSFASRQHARSAHSIQNNWGKSRWDSTDQRRKSGVTASRTQAMDAATGLNTR